MYKIILPNFEGPLDLLIYFIKREQLDLFDIPIAKITEEFLTYIKLMEYLDIEVTSEFLVMAATLMQIKSQMLLPHPEKEQQADDYIDLKQELVEKLIEYDKIKETSQIIFEMIKDKHYLYYRGITESQISDFAKKYKTYKNIKINDLVEIVQNLYKKNINSRDFTLIKISTLNIEKELERVESLLSSKGQIDFSNLVAEKSKPYKILTFIAILELIKQKKALALQNEPFDDIILFSISSQN